MIRWYEINMWKITRRQLHIFTYSKLWTASGTGTGLFFHLHGICFLSEIIKILFSYLRTTHFFNRECSSKTQTIHFTWEGYLWDVGWRGHWQASCTYGNVLHIQTCSRARAYADAKVLIDVRTYIACVPSRHIWCGALTFTWIHRDFFFVRELIWLSM